MPYLFYDNAKLNPMQSHFQYSFCASVICISYLAGAVAHIVDTVYSSVTVHICLCYERVSLGFDNLSNQHAHYSVGFLFSGIQPHLAYDIALAWNMFT